MAPSPRSTGHAPATGQPPILMARHRPTRPPGGHCQPALAGPVPPLALAPTVCYATSHSLDNERPMADISYSARAGTSQQSLGSGKAESWQEDDAEELRRFRAKVELTVERLKHELKTRTKSPTEIARERLANAPRRTEAEMRELLETQLSHYATLPDDWDGYSSKAVSPDTLTDARKFLAMRPDDIRLPYPSLGTDGSVELCWDSADLSVSISFEGDGKFHFLVLRYSGGKKTGRDWAEDCPIDAEWPEALANPLREL